MFLFGAAALVIAAGSFLWFAKRQNNPDAAASAKHQPLSAADSANAVAELKADADDDRDGLKNFEEALWKTDPKNSDTNGDGISDGKEVAAGRDPLTGLSLDQSAPARPLSSKLSATEIFEKYRQTPPPAENIPAAVSPSVQNQKQPPSYAVPSRSANPNLENLDWYIAAVKQVGQKQGFAADKLATIEQYVRSVAATTTDLKGEFVKQVKLAEAKKERFLAEQAETNPNPFVRVGLRLLAALKRLVPAAEAQMGVPFGGQLYYAIPCTCSGAWNVGISPLPPTYPVLLDYMLGTQMYAYWSAPFALSFLGEYYPGVPICWMYAGIACFTWPSEGMMSPMLGTSVY